MRPVAWRVQTTMTIRTCILLFGCLAGCLLGVDARANIVLGGTRIIYPQGEREVTIALSNKGSAPALVQSWMDDGAAHSTPENSSAPFLIMPPITRIEAQASQTLRILFNGTPLPTTRESLFWLNVLEIPPVSAEAREKNNLLLAIQSRIKVFYRPASVSGSLHEAAESLKWAWVKDGAQWQLRCTNTSPFYVSFAQLSTLKAGQTLVNGDGTQMVEPGGEIAFKLTPAAHSIAGLKEGQVRFEYINDYGALKQVDALVQ